MSDLPPVDSPDALRRLAEIYQLGREIGRPSRICDALLWAADEITALRAQIATLSHLVDDADRVLDIIPPCPHHGKCTPNAVQWVETCKAAGFGSLESEGVMTLGDAKAIAKGVANG